MTSINLLRVSAPACLTRQVYTARHDTLNTAHLHESSSDYNVRDRCVYTDSIQNKQLRTCTWNGCHTVSVSQYCNFMFINVMCLRILIIPMSAMHTKFGVLGLYSFDLKDPLRMVPSRRNM